MITSFLWINFQKYFSYVSDKLHSTYNTWYKSRTDNQFERTMFFYPMTIHDTSKTYLSARLSGNVYVHNIFHKVLSQNYFFSKFHLSYWQSTTGNLKKVFSLNCWLKSWSTHIFYIHSVNDELLMFWISYINYLFLMKYKKKENIVYFVINNVLCVW